MTTSPVPHQLPGSPGGNISRTEPTVKSKRRLLALEFNVEVWRIMVSEIHSDDDSEERRDDWHARFLANSGIQA